MQTQRSLFLSAMNLTQTTEWQEVSHPRGQCHCSHAHWYGWWVSVYGHITPNTHHLIWHSACQAHPASSWVLLLCCCLAELTSPFSKMQGIFYFIHIFLMCVHASLHVCRSHMCVGGCTCMWVHMHPEVQTWWRCGLSLIALSPYSVKWSLSDAELLDTASLTSQFDLGSLSPPSVARIMGRLPCPVGICIDSEDMNAGSHFCPASA